MSDSEKVKEVLHATSLFGPSYEYDYLEDKRIKVIVTPPSWSMLKSSTIILSEDQFKRFNDWRAGDGLIQNILPDLSPSQREILLTGLDDSQWNDMFEKGDEVE